MADTVKAKKAKSAPKAAPAQAKDRVADVAAKTDVKTDAAVKQAKSVETQPEVKAEKIAAENKEAPVKSAPVKAEKAKEVKSEDKKRKKILLVASEALPYVKTGGLADVAASLPKALNAAGYDCRVIMPLYFDISDDFKHTMRYLGNVYVPLAWRNQYCGVFTQTYDGVTYYFIDNEFYFKRRGLYGHYDDGERFAFFSKAVLESMSVTDFYPDIIHANDWHTALTPVYLDVFYRGIPALSHVKTVFTIHNIQFQGQYGDGIIGDVLGLPSDRASLVMYKGCANYMKGAIECSNVVTTVSPTYACEILDPYYGYEMEDILRSRSYKLHGIVNGIDEKRNDPATDKALFVNYDLEHYSKKAENKVNLQRMLGLPENPDVAMIGMVGRLTEQKGLDLVAGVLENIMQMPVQLVVLGQGDWRYEDMFKRTQNEHNAKFRCVLGFSSDLASKIYGASDMFLMPSKFEPCGLSQLIAMRYGSVPIVRETGGLKDTVKAYDCTTGEGNGLTFYSYNAYDMLDAIRRAVGLYYDYKQDWSKVVTSGMRGDYSWSSTAKSYADLYESL